jgi:hypothetical protein
MASYADMIFIIIAKTRWRVSVSRLYPRQNAWLTIARAVLFLLAESRLGQNSAPTHGRAPASRIA